jgi:hypothetical protein
LSIALYFKYWKKVEVKETATVRVTYDFQISSVAFGISFILRRKYYAI